MGLVVTGGIGLILFRRRFLPEPAPAPTRKGPPRVWIGHEVADPVLLDTDEQQALVWSIGQFVDQTPTQKLDVAATVRATANAAGIPTPRFQYARHQREVWIWLDETAADPSLARLADEIARLLPAYGLNVERAGFRNVPDQLITSTRDVFAPVEIEERSLSALVIVLTDGAGLVRRHEADQHRVRIQALLRMLSHWPHLWFVDPTEGASGMAEVLSPHAITCIHPRELVARIAGHAAARRSAEGATTDESIWAAACALSPSPVAEGTAWQIHRALQLTATPWSFHAMQQSAPGPSNRLEWAPADRAACINWLANCEVQDSPGAAKSKLERALDFWEQTLQDEATKRSSTEGATWNDSPAERRLRVDQALISLWRTPKEAIETLFPNHQGPLKEAIEAQMRVLAPRDRGSNNQIHLPWRWEDRTAVEQHMLLAMGFAGDALAKARLVQRPGRFWLGLSLGGALAIGALLIAALRPSVPASGPPVFVHGTGKPGAVREEIAELANGQWRVAVTLPKWFEERTVAPGTDIRVDWLQATQPCVVALDGGELWRCTGPVVPKRANDKLQRSLAVLAADSAHARPLAVALLDSGNVDLVLIDPQWPRYRDRLIGSVNATEADEQLLIIVRGASREDQRITGQRVLFLEAKDISALAKSLDFAGVRPLPEVWPSVRVIAGDAKHFAMNGAPQGCRPREVTDPTGMAFVELCAGTFTMGSPPGEKDRDNDEIQHQVTLSAFAIGKFEVTEAQNRQFKAEKRPDNDVPAVNVTWQDAKAFCESKGYRLPTEAEWEYAARAGTKTRWSFGDDESKLEDFAWYAKNAGSERRQVGQKKPNPWGLHDMHGNVWEWVADWYGPYRSEPQTDPTGPDAGTQRVLRGGAFNLGPRDLRSADRVWFEPEGRGGDFGFRCARGPRRQP